MSKISIEDAEKIATEFIKKKRAQAEEITVNAVTPFGESVQVSGTYTDPRFSIPSNWEVKIGKDRKVYEYRIP